LPLPVTYVEEDKPGLNHARNRAVAESRYDVVAFLDDDVDVDPGWLEALSAAHESGNPAAVGGRAFLVYPAERPSWLGVRDEYYLTKVELGTQRRTADAYELAGVNVSFRKEWFDRVGLFRPDLDRVGKCLLSGGETELLERIGK